MVSKLISLTPRSEFYLDKYLHLVFQGIVLHPLNKGALLRFLTTLVLLYFALLSDKEIAAIRQILSEPKLILAIPIWAGINLIFGVYATYKEIKNLGWWEGNRFIYKEPKLVFSYAATPSKQASQIPFRIEGVKPGTFVHLEAKCVGGIATMTLIRGLQKNRGGNKIGLRIPPERKLVLDIDCPTNSDLTLIKVYMLSWEIYPV